MCKKARISANFNKLDYNQLTVKKVFLFILYFCVKFFKKYAVFISVS